MSITENIKKIRNNIETAAKKAKRKSEHVRILAATKLVTVDRIQEAVEAGISTIGENKVQEAEEKFSLLPKVEKHMIGHLQTNKVKRAVRLFDIIESVDSLRLANEINKCAFQINKTMPIFIEVNVAGEDTKYGAPISEVPALYDKIVKLMNIKIGGLMTIAPFVDIKETRPYFKKMFKLRKQLGVKELSMGMSNDYSVAVEEGSTIVRLGTAIFGLRS